MRNRVMIFSLDKQVQDRIANATLRNLSGKKIETQKFFGFDEASGEYAIGEDVLLVIGDEKLRPRGEAKGMSIQERFRKGAFDASVNYCNELEIPYMSYEGELDKDDPKGLDAKFNLLCDKIIGRY